MSYWRLLARIYQGIRSSYSVWQISECELRDPDNVYNCASCGVSNTPCEHWAKHKAKYERQYVEHRESRRVEREAIQGASKASTNLRAMLPIPADPRNMQPHGGDSIG